MSDPSKCTPSEGGPKGLIIKSPFQDRIESFNIEDFSDLEFCIPGNDAPIHLHRMILGQASNALKQMFVVKKSMGGEDSEESHRVEWFAYMIASDDISMYRDVLIKLLRFCYGEQQTFSADECPSALVLLFQLELKNGNEWIETVEKYMITAAVSDVKIATMMLEGIVREYAKFDDERLNSFRESFARELFIRYNVINHFDDIIGCLVKLPVRYLDFVEHEEGTKLGLILQYMEYNALDDESKREIMNACDGSGFSDDELNTIEKLTYLDEKEKNDLRQRALEGRNQRIRIVDGSLCYSSFSVEWKNEIPEDQRDSSEYYVLVKTVESAKDIVYEYHGQKNSTQIVGLIPETHYLVKCQARCSGAITKESFLDVTTPTIPPLGLQVESNTVTCFSVKLKWNHFINDDISASQEHKYVLQMKQGNGDWEQVYANSSPFFEKDDLVPDSRYSFRVRFLLVNNKKQNLFYPFSEVVEVKTPEVPVPALSLAEDAFSYCSATILCECDSQQLALGHGVPYHYDITMEGNGSGKQVVFSGNKTTFSKNDLSPGGTYRFSAQLIFDKHPTFSSASSEPIVVKKDPIPTPVIKLVDGSLSIRSLELTWDTEVPLQKSMYSYKVYRLVSGEWEPEYSGNNTRKKINGLEPGTKYFFKANIVLSNGVEGPFSDDVFFSTNAIPAVEFDLKRTKNSNLSFAVEHDVDVNSFFSKEDSKDVTYEFWIEDKTLLEDNTIIVHSLPFTKRLTPEHTYSIRGRVVWNDDEGSWSREKDVKIYESFPLTVLKVLYKYFSWLVWELGSIVVIWGVVYELGLFCDNQPNFLYEWLLTFTVLFASLILYPILFVLLPGCKPPPLLSCIVLPFKEGGRHGNQIATKVFYAISLFLLYAGTFMSLVLLCKRVNGTSKETLTFSLAPFFCSWFAVPAVSLPVLFACRMKGRHSILFFYFFFAISFSDIILIALYYLRYGHGVKEASEIVFLVNFSSVFLFHLIVFIVCCARKMVKVFFVHLFPFILVVSIPTFYVMPLLLHSEALCVNAFSPMYIDLLVFGILSIVFKIADFCADNSGTKALAWYIRGHFVALRKDKEKFEKFHL